MNLKEKTLMRHQFSSKEMELNGQWYVAYDKEQIGKKDGW